MRTKVFIIGSGIAGMACAIRLAVHGFEVTVFEKNNYPGGKSHLIEQDGYRFDAGPSLFVQPGNIEELFKLCNEDIQQYFNYAPIEVGCKYFYEDGVVLNAYSNKELLAEELESKTGEATGHIISYLEESKAIYKHTGEIFLNNSLHKASTWFHATVLKALLHTKPSYIFSTLNNANKRKFSSPHVVQLFNRFATYNGSSPYKAPAMLQLIPHIEFNEGVFYPKGGMVAVSNALYNLAKKMNVQFYFNSPVQKIITQHNRATGLLVNEKGLYADVVVSNADVYFTYRLLLNDKHKANEILRQERSSSAIVFYWGIKKEFTQLALHNIFFSKNYEAEFRSIFNTKTVYADPTIYINITSKCEPGNHAPAGKENWFVMVNVASDVKMSEPEIIQSYKKNIIAKLRRMLQTDIEPLIETEAVLHPQKIEAETSGFAGAIYGTASNSRHAAFSRHPNFCKTICGLYFAGGTVHPGGGIPLCLKSAEITSNLIIKNSSKYIA
ncbi:1-hydroxycarotenoid 3,4-desaturase CrtD [Parafilimonas sp.]|uniref:1-hydroxycarotenoid 3,4-desaturase CrtD n=1 Tax=Parafilimonas sp. TaxID=1969739 RepID=UPI0039E5B10C